MNRTHSMKTRSQTKASIREKAIKTWRENLQVGDKIDALDTSWNVSYTPKWYEAVITKIVGNDRYKNKKYYVHFQGWKPRFNEFIPINSERIQPIFSKTTNWRTKIVKNSKVEIRKFKPKHGRPNFTLWVKGKVKKIKGNVDSITCQLLVSSEGWWDQWYNLYNNDAITKTNVHCRKKKKIFLNFCDTFFKKYLV